MRPPATSPGIRRDARKGDAALRGRLRYSLRLRWRGPREGRRAPSCADGLCRNGPNPVPPQPESGPARMMRGEGTFVVADLQELPAYHAGDALVRAIVDLAGARSVVISPLRKDAVTLGAITIYRQEVRPFTEKQIALLENFAAQAVIAMENARLIDEIRTARRRRSNVARTENRPGQSDTGGEDGIARPAHRRHRARDQEPAKLHQQLLRPVGGTAGRIEGDCRTGLRGAGYGSGGRNRRRARDAHQQSGKDHRARATRRRHRPRHAGTFARRVRRAADGSDQRSGRRDTEPRLPRRARPGSEFQHHAGTGFRRWNPSGRGEPAGPDAGVPEYPSATASTRPCGGRATAQTPGSRRC